MENMQPEDPQDTALESAPKKNATRVSLALVILGVLVLGAAAFWGGRLLTGQGLGGGPKSVTYNDGNGNTTTVTEYNMEPAPERPADKPKVSGLLDHREDNSLFIGTGDIRAVGDADGNVRMEHDGPLVEVVVNHATVVYRDATDREATDAQGVTQEVWEPGSLDDIQDSGLAIVWGDKQGDRVLAKTVLYFSN